MHQLGQDLTMFSAIREYFSCLDLKATRNRRREARERGRSPTNVLNKENGLFCLRTPVSVFFKHLQTHANTINRPQAQGGERITLGSL